MSEREQAGEFGSASGILRLRQRHRAAVHSFLLAQRHFNAYLLSLVERGGLLESEVGGPLLGYVVEGRLQGVCCIGSNLNISMPCSPEAVETFADFARRGGIPFWVAVGPDATIKRFMDLYGRKSRAVRAERSGQVLYTLSEAPEGPTDQPSPALRLAQLEDHENLCRLDRAMVAAAWNGTKDADLVLLLIDAKRGIDRNTRQIITQLKKNSGRVVLAFNKIDLINKRDLLSMTSKVQNLKAFEHIFMISAILGDGIE